MTTIQAPAAPDAPAGDAPTVPTVSSPTTREGWRRALAFGGLAYVLSRLCAVAGAAVVAAQVRVADAAERAENLANGVADTDPPLPGGFRLIMNVFTSWDGRWYLEITRHGYPRRVPADITFHQDEARAAFFPLFPDLVRVADKVIPAGDTVAAIFVNLVLGAVFIYLAGLLARGWWGDVVAGKVMMLLAVFPASVVLTMAYSEALMLALSAGCLLAMERRRWLLAGVLAAFVTAARPNGVAICAACAVAAFIAIKRRREWAALIAPALSPLGFIAFQVFLDRHTHETGVWARVQREAWSEGTSFGWTAIRRSFEAFAHPMTSPTDTVTALSVATLAVLLVASWRRRPTWPALFYSAVVVGLMLLPSTVTARPRFIYTAFPVVMAFAAWWELSPTLRRRFSDSTMETLWALFIGVNCAGLAALTALYGVYGVIP